MFCHITIPLYIHINHEGIYLLSTIPVPVWCYRLMAVCVLKHHNVTSEQYDLNVRLLFLIRRTALRSQYITELPVKWEVRRLLGDTWTQRGRNTFLALTEKTMGNLKECSEEVKGGWEKGVWRTGDWGIKRMVAGDAGLQGGREVKERKRDKESREWAGEVGQRFREA